VTGVIGTLDYISPEQIQGASDVDGRADIYSMGVMTYQLLTGSLPFQHTNPAAILIAHLMEPPADPTRVNGNVSERAGAAILRSLAKKPEERYPTAAAFVTALAV
jgi:serine/threonine-protein kinase